MMRDLLIEAQTGEPAPCQVHAQFFHQFPLAGNAVQIANQQNAQQQLGINRRSARLAVASLQPLPHESKADVPFDESQEVGFRNLIFQAEVIPILRTKVSEGYTALWERGRLDLTVEAVIHDNPKWHPLFTQEDLAICAKRLREYRYLE